MLGGRTSRGERRGRANIVAKIFVKVWFWCDGFDVGSENIWQDNFGKSGWFWFESVKKYYCFKNVFNFRYQICSNN